MTEEFHLELDSFEIYLPGNHCTRFSDTDALRNFFLHQYPRWKVPGIVTSIPAGRIPRLFLSDDQMTASFQRQLSSLQKGESGEIDIYTSLLNTKGLEDGILVLPNVDGNFFESYVAHVELDMIVVHPLKGAFVFNVKNAKNVRESKLCEDMVKHCNFIRLIQTYGGYVNETNDNRVPVHGVVCSLAKTLSLDSLKAKGYYDAPEKGKRFVIQPNDMENFSESLLSILSQVPNVGEDNLDLVEILAMRLGALNSMEGAIAMIHKKVVGNDIHTIQRKEEVGIRILGDCINESMSNGTRGTRNKKMELLREDLLELQISKQKGKNVSFFLWTKEQQNVISDVTASLLSGLSIPCRMIVSGPKGSGKTMLLVFIARLAQKIFLSQNRDTDSKVSIYDGRMESGSCSHSLFEKLSADLKGTGIIVDRKKRVVGEKFKGKLLLFDECVLSSVDAILDKIEDGQHVILFSSLKQVFSAQNVQFLSSYKKFELRNSLRSTCEIVQFVEKFRLLQQEPGECEVIAAHNLRGAAPHIQAVMVDEKSDPLHTGYVDAAVSTIRQIKQRGCGLKEILITPFVHHVTLLRIFKKVGNYSYHIPEDFASELSEISMGINRTGRSGCHRILPQFGNEGQFPGLLFATGNHIDGSEYGAVIVLLERSLPCYWETFMHSSLFIAMTRATTMLSIIINDAVNPPVIQHKFKSTSEEVWNDFIFPVDVDIPAYNFIKCNRNDFCHYLEGIIKDSSWSKDPVFLLGDDECPGFLEATMQQNVFVNEKHITADDPIMSKRSGPSFVNEEIKWYKVGSKMMVSAKKYSSFSLFFDKYINMLDIEKCSALVFLVPSTQAYTEMLCKLNRHTLLHSMMTKELEKCPIYILTSCKRTFEFCSVNSICNFMTSFSIPYDKLAVHGVSKSIDIIEESVSKPWEALKALGNSFYKDWNLELALSLYINSYRKLKDEFNSSLQFQDILLSYDLLEKLSKLCTNISKTYFDLAAHGETGLDVHKMKLSLKYAEMSMNLDPFWFKGHHRMIEAKQVLWGKYCPLEIKKRKEAVSRIHEPFERYHVKHNIVLREILKKSVAWEQLRFKDNAVLVDRNGNGHFRSISEALSNMNPGPKPLSVLINPGFYVEDILINKRTIDLVGNVDPERLGNCPIITQPTVNRRFSVESSTVFISRVNRHFIGAMVFA